MGQAELMLYSALLAAGISTAMFVHLFMVARAEGEVLVDGVPRRGGADGALRQAVVWVARTLAPLHRNVEETRRGQDLERLLKRAGRPLGMKAAEYLTLRYLGAAVGAALGYALGLQISGETEWLYMFGLGAFGFFYPMFRLKALATKRQMRIFRDLPYVLDLLTLSTEAGQDFSSAMATVVEKGPPGPLVEEFRIAHQEVTLGKTRSDALRAMATRVDLQELSSFVLALIQAEQLGASIAKVLRIMAEQMRVKRATVAEEMTGKVPVKLMAPLITCIFPASFIILFVPIFLRAQIEGGGF